MAPVPASRACAGPTDGWTTASRRKRETQARGMLMTIGGKIKQPRGGARTTINGRAAHWRNGELRIATLPAGVFIAVEHTKGKP